MGSLGDESNLLHGPNGVVGNELSELGGSEDGSVVVESLSLGVVSLQRVEPVNLVSTVGEIVLDEDWWERKEKRRREGERREEVSFS